MHSSYTCTCNIPPVMTAKKTPCKFFGSSRHLREEMQIAEFYIKNVFESLKKSNHPLKSIYLRYLRDFNVYFLKFLKYSFLIKSFRFKHNDRSHWMTSALSCVPLRDSLPWGPTADCCVQCTWSHRLDRSWNSGS